MSAWSGRDQVPYLNLRIMTPFRASYFHVYLTWEPSEGIADTLGKCSILCCFFSFDFLFSFFFCSLFCLPLAKKKGPRLQVSD